MARVVIIVLISKKSWQKSLGEGFLNECRLRAYSLCESLHKLFLLLQRFLQAKVGSLCEDLRNLCQVSRCFLPEFGFLC
jgi:hypothetical protein